MGHKESREIILVGMFGVLLKEGGKADLVTATIVWHVAIEIV